MKVGWIGLGEIGAGMVVRALAAGHEVTAFARGAGLPKAQAAGALTSSDYKALAAASEVLGICVFSDAQLADVLFEQGALAALKPGAVLAIHTTGSPKLAQEIGARAPDGVGVLDATFSGGPAEVEKGDLTLMVGGSVEALERARPVLATYCARIHHVGGLGQGQTIKLLNNLLFSANLHLASEALRMAEQQGFKPWEAARIIQQCSGRSMAMGLFEREAPVEAMLGSVRPYMEKDVTTAAKSAAEAGFDLSAFASTVDFFKPR